MWRWIDDFCLCPTELSRLHLQRTRGELLMALSYPYADVDTLALLDQWIAWFFVVDDELDDGPCGRDPGRCLTAVSSLMQTFDGRPDAGILPTALFDLCGRTLLGRSNGWRESFRRGFTEWLWTYYAEAVDRAGGRQPASWEYREHRRYSFGVYMSLDFCELADGIDLPCHVRHLPSFVSLRNSAINNGSLINDVFSFDKESAVGYFHNLVAIIQRESRLRREEAVETATLMATEAMERITTAVGELPAQLRAAKVSESTFSDACRLADCYQTLVAGNYVYHKEVQRYASSIIEDDWASDHVPGLFT